MSIPPLFPSVKLFYFIPFLVRSFYIRPLSSCLWIALGAGLFLDLFSAHHRFGLYSANYVITTYFLYGLKRNFFEDSLTTLPFMTFFFSTASSLIHILLILLLEKQAIPISLPFIFIDLFLMPFYDACFAFCIFSLPRYFFGRPIKKGSDYFLSHED